MKFLKYHPKFLVTIIFLFLVILGIVYVNIEHYQDKRNIFDEIYFVEKDIYPQSNTVLNRIEGISTCSYTDINKQFQGAAEEGYDSTYTPSGYNNVGLSFYFKNEKFVFSYHKMIDSETKIAIFNKYLVKEKRMIRSLVFIKGGEWIENSKQIEDLRKQYNITDQVLEQYNKEILNDFFLRDWCKVYDSKYTPNNWGDVKVEKGWE